MTIALPTLAGPTLLLVAHGSSTDPAVSDQVYAQAKVILSHASNFTAVKVAFWKEEPYLHTALPAASGHVVIAPLLMAKGYFFDTVFPRELGLYAPENASRVTYLPPLGVDEQIPELIAEVASRPGLPHLIVAGHGTPRHAESRVTLEHAVAVLQSHPAFATVAAGFIDDEPGLAQTFADPQYDHGTVVVVPFFATDGPHVKDDIRAQLPDASQRGIELIVLDALGGHPILARRIAARAEAVQTTAPSAARPQLTTALEALGRRAIDAGALGPLRIASYAAGWRLSHIEATRSQEFGLDVLACLRRSDAAPPLRSAPGGIPTDWHFDATSPLGLGEAIESIFPGAAGLSEVRDWETTVAAQTGRYARLSTMPAPHVTKVVKATCDMRCARHRCWRAPGEQAREALRAEDLPCPRPCNFLFDASLSK